MAFLDTLLYKCAVTFAQVVFYASYLSLCKKYKVHMQEFRMQECHFNRTSFAPECTNFCTVGLINPVLLVIMTGENDRLEVTKSKWRLNCHRTACSNLA